MGRRRERSLQDTIVNLTDSQRSGLIAKDLAVSESTAGWMNVARTIGRYEVRLRQRQPGCRPEVGHDPQVLGRQTLRRQRADERQRRKDHVRVWLIVAARRRAGVAAGAGGQLPECPG